MEQQEAMIALDTNIVARLIVRDNEAQLQTARTLLLDNSCFISWTVLIELGWVLDAIYGLTRDEIVAGVESLLLMETVAVADEEALRWAIDRFAAGSDWADMLHLASCDPSVEVLASFDRKIGRQAGSSSPIEVRLL
jgi:predicted nucleic-acid-binding protein